MSIRDSLATLADFLDGWKTYIVQAVGCSLNAYFLIKHVEFETIAFVNMIVQALSAACRLYTRKPGALAKVPPQETE